MRLAVVLLALAAVAAPVAEARVIRSVAPADQLVQGPVLAGARVAWEERRCNSPEGCDFVKVRVRVRAAGPRGVRTLHSGRTRSLPGGSNSFFSSLSFDLSSRALAVQRSVLQTLSEQESSSHRLSVGGPSGGDLRRVFECSREFGSSSVFDLDRGLLAYDPNPCDDQAQVAVRDVATRERRTIDLGAGTLDAVALAGNLVAHVRGTTVAIHDHTTGAELFSAALPAGTLHGIDLARDGRLAVSVGSVLWARRTCWRSELWLRAAGGATLEEQTAKPCWDARFTSNGIAYLSGNRRPLTLEHTDSAGGVSTIVSFGRRLAWEDFDAQGSRAAYGVTCRGRTLLRVVTLDRTHSAC
jgi:hypothetical protein